MSVDELELTAPAPCENSYLAGHAETERLFVDAFGGGRLAHAWLITGPRGIGKATLAFRLARFILAQKSGAPVNEAALEMAPSDPLFRRIASGGHADLLVVERAVDPKTEKRRTEITVDNVRNVKGFLSKTPAEGGWRVVIVDAADEMNANAANALLKVLEEPPARALLLLVAHNPGRLLPTIRSRCRKLTAKPLSDETVGDLLGRYRPDLDAADRQTLVALAEGSIGRALAYADEEGMGLYREAIRLLDNMPGVDVQAVHKFADTAVRDTTGEAFRSVGDLVRWWLARRVAEGVSGTVGALDPWFEVWEKVTRLFERADSVNLDRKQVILNAFLAIDAAGR